jgi:hypothetical protein
MVIARWTIILLTMLTIPAQAQRDKLKELDELFDAAYCVGALKADLEHTPTPEAKARRERYAAYVVARTEGRPKALQWTNGAAARGERESAAAHASGQQSERLINCRSDRERRP